jgi:hypothetical protein
MMIDSNGEASRGGAAILNYVTIDLDPYRARPARSLHDAPDTGLGAGRRRPDR